MSSPKTSHCTGKCFTIMAIINAWNLVDFKNIHGKCRVGKFTTKSGERFSAVTFGESPNWVMVAFSSSLGELSPAEIVAQKDDLQVVLRDSQVEEGKTLYTLCRKGNVELEDVDL